MALSSELISQFAKITNNEKDNRITEATLYGVVVECDDLVYVRFDGASELTPVTTVTEKDEDGNITNFKYGAARVKTGDRVSVSLKNHSATITGNLSDPAMGKAEFTVEEDYILARVGEVSLRVDSLGVTITGLEDGTTVINGGCIQTGTIDAQYLNLTGSITFNDLSEEVQEEITEIEELANQAIDDASSAASSASSARSVARSIANGTYVGGTFISKNTIQSPLIEGNDIRVYGTFQTMGYDGVDQIVTGYMGAAQGLDAAGNDTYGVALSYKWDSDTQEVSDKYVIVTNGGVRMQAGTHSITVTASGCFIDGEPIGTAGSTAVFG